LPPSIYRLDGVVDVSGMPVMFVGSQAIEGYRSETGQRVPGTQTMLTLRKLEVLNAPSLRRLADDMVQLLGDKHKTLRASDQRGRSSKTPPTERHGLIELIEHATQAADQFEAARSGETVDIDPQLIAELLITTSLLERWSRHPRVEFWHHRAIPVPLPLSPDPPCDLGRLRAS
jgi:hypothetical protein